MLKKMRSAHPIRFCVVAEVLWLVVMLVASLIYTVVIVVADLWPNDYLGSIFQEAFGIAIGLCLLRRTGRQKVLTRRGCGFLDGMLVAMFPFAFTAYTLFDTLIYDVPDIPLLPAFDILCYFAAMILVGISEEIIFRAVIARTLLEHFGASRAGVWKAALLSGALFGASHLINVLSSSLSGVFFQCIFAFSLGVTMAAIYFRTGNLKVVIFIHAFNDIVAMLIGGLYGTTSLAESISSYSPALLLTVAIYLMPAVWLLRKSKLPEVALFSGVGEHK